MHHLDKDEFSRLLKEIPNERWRTMLKVSLYHGLRVSETLSLKRENIADGYVHIRRLKGSDKTSQHYVPDEARELSTLYTKTKPGELLFPITRSGVFRLMKRAAVRAGIPLHKVHPHALKHSCAMQLIEKIGIHELQTYLGHKSLSSTGAYLNPDEDTVSKKAAAAFGGM